MVLPEITWTAQLTGISTDGRGHCKRGLKCTKNIKREHPPLGLSRAGGREAPTQEEVELAGPDKGVSLSGESLCGHTPLL